jgi:hypothetical protein
MTDGFLQLKIEGPRGTVAQAQIKGNLAKMRASWLPDTFKAFGDYVRQVVLNRNFASEGTYLGGRWQSIDPEYRAWKIRVFGSQANFIGRRSLALRHAMTMANPKPFTRAGPPGRTIRAVPILDYDARSVTIGAKVYENGNEYAEHFDASRPVFGEGKMPQEIEIEGGKLLSLPYLSSTHTDEFGKPSYDNNAFPSKQVTNFLSVRALRAAAS